MCRWSQYHPQDVTHGLPIRKLYALLSLICKLRMAASCSMFGLTTTKPLIRVPLILREYLQYPNHAFFLLEDLLSLLFQTAYYAMSHASLSFLSRQVKCTVHLLTSSTLSTARARPVISGNNRCARKRQSTTTAISHSTFWPMW
jgi:hypothetical protein